MLGSSLYLKNKIGRGFRITLGVEQEHQAKVLEFCASMLPGSTVLLVAGTNITISAPKSITRIMPEFLE